MTQKSIPKESKYGEVDLVSQALSHCTKSLCVAVEEVGTRQAGVFCKGQGCRGGILHLYVLGRQLVSASK